jgi:hypothetical protein
VVGLALLPGLFFWRLLTPDPADHLHIMAGDFTDQYYPLRAYATGQLLAGRLPLWNPFLYGGQPALADIQSGVLYPPQLFQLALLYWLGTGFSLDALEIQAIVHFSWAAVGAYMLGRRLGVQRGTGKPSARVGRFTGLVVSLVFTYSGYLTGFPVQQVTILEVSAWLPWVLLSIDQLAAAVPGGWRQWSRPVLGTGLTLGLALLPGHPQTWLYVVYLAVGFYAWRVFTLREQETGFRRLKAAGALLFALAFALALTAAQWLPTLEFAADSPRADMNYQSASFGLPVHELVALIYPGYLGGSPEYVGILPLLLIGLAWALGRPRRQVVFWSGVGLLALVLGLGGNTFLYSLAYLLAPGFGAVRHQERSFLIYALSAAILSGYGAQAIVSPLNRLRLEALQRFERGARLAGAVGLAATALFVYGWAGSDQRELFGGVLRHHVFGLLLLAGSLTLLALRPTRGLRRSWGMALLAGWIAFNLFSVNWRFNLQPPGAPPAFAATPLVEYLRAQLAGLTQPVRIASAGLLPGGAGAAAVYGFEDTTGNTPLHLAAVEAFEAAVPEWRRWQLLNVHYVLGDHDLDGPGLTRLFPAAVAQDDNKSVRLYAMNDPFPRAWVVHTVEVIPDQAAALARLGEDAFDLRRAAVVAEQPGLALPGPTDGSTAQVTALSPEELSVEVDAVANGVLVLSEISYPGWRASLDGTPVSLLRADGLLRGIAVPGGHHTVRLWYAPGSVWLGLVISGVAAVGGLGGWIAAGRTGIGRDQGTPAPTAALLDPQEPLFAASVRDLGN